VTRRETTSADLRARAAGLEADMCFDVNRHGIP
jgi:hypothetical protein